MTSSCFCNVRNKVVLMCWKFRRMLSSKCQVMLLPSGLLLVAEVVEAPSGMRLSVSVAKESHFLVFQVLMAGQQLELEAMLFL